MKTQENYIFKLKKIGAITILSTLEKISSTNFKCIKQNESEKYLKAPKLTEKTQEFNGKNLQMKLIICKRTFSFSISMVFS